ncbi:MAG TPA: hypothetical protein VOA87_06620 [Thermoanaerobaculia bacterium]|nr:hypothetical protein [Thermoanaerobaculia bacterium]
MKESKEMASEPEEPSTVVWDWRRSTGEAVAAATATEAAAQRRRGLIGAAVGLVFAAILHHFRPTAGLVVAALALASGIVALAAPLTLYRRLTSLLDRFAHAVGTLVTWVLMTLLFYLFFLPVGAFLRLSKKLAITTGFDSRLTSYWSAAEAARRDRGEASYKQQF